MLGRWTGQIHIETGDGALIAAPGRHLRLWLHYGDVTRDGGVYRSEHHAAWFVSYTLRDAAILRKAVA